MEEYINIYNQSLDKFLFSFSKGYNLSYEKLHKEYNYIHVAKCTGYMLYVQDMNDANNEFSNKPKIISKMWKELDKKLKKEYNAKAIKLKKKNNSTEPEVEEIKEIKKDEILYDELLYNTTLTEIIHNDKKYIKDVFDNVINIEGNEGTYIGYFKDGEIIFY